MSKLKWSADNSRTVFLVLAVIVELAACAGALLTREHAYLIVLAENLCLIFIVLATRKKAARGRQDVVLLSFSALLLVLLVVSLNLHSFFFESKDGLSLWVTLLEAVGIIPSIILAIIQLRESKEISRAEFITELNRSFVENADYKKVYDALQAIYDGEEGAEARGLALTKGEISNYLTFFETLYLLCTKGVVSFDIIDDLFAYRFFLAAHSKIVQESKIRTQPENWRNIFRLEREWLDYRVKIGKNSEERLKSCRDEFRSCEGDMAKEDQLCWKNVYEMRQLEALLTPENYDIYRGKKEGPAIFDAKEFQYAVCTAKDVPDILALQDAVIGTLEAPELLRKNTAEMFESCTQAPNVTLGVRYRGKLVALAILFVPGDDEENLARYIRPEFASRVTANYKLCIVDREFRGNSLQVILGRKLEKYAAEAGAELICATVSPDNEYSERNMLRLGYRKVKSIQKYGFSRNLFCKALREDLAVCPEEESSET